MDNSEYFLQKHPIISENDYPIDEYVWSEIKKHTTVISNLISIEQKYDLLLSNYYEFEKQLLECALKYSFHLSNYAQLSKTRLSIVRVLINLLMSIVLYEEQLRKRHLKRISLDETQYAVFNDEINNYCNSDSDFRFIKELRNYVLHNDLPLDMISFSMNLEKIEKEDLEKRGVHVIPTIKVNKLKTDKHFKNNRIKEIMEKDGKIDLRLHIRKVISRLSMIHKNLREKSNENYNTSEEYLKDIIDSFNTTLSEGNNFCYAIDKAKSEEYIFLGYSQFERLKEFKENNFSYPKLETKYIHNRIK